MKSVKMVRAIAAGRPGGEVLGWMSVDMFAERGLPTDAVFLRDGSVCSKAEAMERVASDLTLLYASEEEAIRDGIERLFQADGEHSGNSEECDCPDCIDELPLGHVRDEYEDGNCPDCEKPIPDDAVEGSECEICGHVFGYPHPDDD